MQLIYIVFIWLISLKAQIIEIKHINEALGYIQADSLFLLDLDNTVFEPANEDQIGSDQWFYSTLQSMQQEMSHEAAKQTLSILLNTIMLNASLQLVEYNSAVIVNQITQQCTTLGFTARNLILAPSTNNWLKHHGIELNAPVRDQGFMIDEYPILLYDKVVYCNGHKTGKTLFTILETFGLKPNHIVFIDDKKHYLEMIEAECAKRDIPFIGLRYSYLDEKVEQYLKQAYLNQPEVD